MNKIMFAVLMILSSYSFAMNKNSIKIQVFCIEGYKYVYSWTQNGNTPTVVQMFKTANDTKIPQPITCVIK